MTFETAEIQRIVIAFMPNLVSGVVLMVLFYAGAVALDRILTRMGSVRHLNPDVVNLFSKSSKWGLIAFGAITVLGTFGINVAALVAGLGLAGFALGIALKDIVQNVLSGVLVLLYRPFTRGDEIEVAGAKGKVVSIDLRYTILEADDKRTLVPNSTLFANAVTVFK